MGPDFWHPTGQSTKSRTPPSSRPPGASSACTTCTTSAASARSDRGSASFAHGAEIVRIQIVADGREPRLAVDTQLSLDVVFDDADSVVDNESVPRVLDELKDHTRDVVAAFAPAFE